MVNKDFNLKLALLYREVSRRDPPLRLKAATENIVGLTSNVSTDRESPSKMEQSEEEYSAI
jgi:hypothetical protein